MKLFQGYPYIIKWLLCERVNYNDYKLDVEIYIQMLINQHRMEPKPHNVAIICLNLICLNLVLVKMTESKCLSLHLERGSNQKGIFS